MTPNRRRRGLALADFLAGLMIFSGTLVAFAGITGAKFEMLDATEMRGRALAPPQAH